MDKSALIESEIDNALNGFGERVKNSGLVLWHRVIGKKINEFKTARKAKDKEIYGELMQIESLASKINCEKSAEIVKKVQKLKGIVGTMCLCFLCVNSALPFRPAVRRTSSNGQARIIKTLRKDESAWISYC